MLIVMNYHQYDVYDSNRLRQLIKDEIYLVSAETGRLLIKQKAARLASAKEASGYMEKNFWFSLPKGEGTCETQVN